MICVASCVHGAGLSGPSGGFARRVARGALLLGQRLARADPSARGGACLSCADRGVTSASGLMATRTIRPAGFSNLHVRFDSTRTIRQLRTGHSCDSRTERAKGGLKGSSRVELGPGQRKNTHASQVSSLLMRLVVVVNLPCRTQR